MGKNGLKMGVWLSFFYKFAENREVFLGRFLPYKLGIETPGVSGAYYGWPSTTQDKYWHQNRHVCIAYKHPHWWLRMATNRDGHTLCVNYLASLHNDALGLHIWNCGFAYLYLWICVCVFVFLHTLCVDYTACLHSDALGRQPPRFMDSFIAVPILPSSLPSPSQS